jgi:hypothetical protein
MALQYKINMFETDGSDANKTLVSFIVEDNVSHEKFAISRSITTASKSNEAIVKEAQAAAQTEIDAWAASYAVVNKIWNPDTEQFE